MTRIDFYLLEQEQTEKARFACRVADKAFRLGHRVYMHAPDEAQARALDDLLWTFQAGSFVPHVLLVAGEPAGEEPVLIGWTEPPDVWHQVLIPLTAEPPSFFPRFERVAEVVGNNDADREQSRARFRFYRDRGYALEVHRL